MRPQPRHSRPKIVLRRREWRAKCLQLGLRNDEQVAKAMGVAASAVWRVRTGRNKPGEEFIAAAMWLLRDPVPDADGLHEYTQFEEIFAVKGGAEQ